MARKDKYSGQAIAQIQACQAKKTARRKRKKKLAEQKRAEKALRA
jgi:hypothetical protein